MKLPASLRTRLILSHLAVSVVSIVIISVFAGNSIFNAARDNIHHRLEDFAFTVRDSLEAPLQELTAGAADPTPLEQILKQLVTVHPELVYTLYWPDGAPIIHNLSEPAPLADQIQTPDVWAALHGTSGEGDYIAPGTNGGFSFVAVRIERENQILGVLRLGTALWPALVSARQSLALLILVAMLVTAGVTLFGWMLANNLAGPILKLTQVAEQLASGDLSARVNPSGPQEMHRLAVAFNIMAVRLQDHVDELRAFVANASHELRTPLTVVKLRAEALRHGALNDPAVAEQFLSEIDGEVDRLGQMVNDLLDLSRMEAGLASKHRSLLNLSVIAQEVYETFSIRASKAGVLFEKHVESNLPSIMGNEDQLRRVLYNLVDNAIKYTNSNGKVDLILESGNRGKTVRLLVKDTGSGISAEHLPHVFERFYRVEATRPRYGTSRGSGLGLAIAKSIVENHGGKIGVSSQLGKGTTFWAEFPAHT